MKKYLWIGTVLMLLAAIGVYKLATFAARNPRSFFGYYLPSAVRIGMGITPARNMKSEVARAKKGPVDKAPAVEFVQPQVRPVPNPDALRQRPVLPQVIDPPEVIKIEEIDPRFVKALREALAHEAELKQFEDGENSESCGPELVVVNVLEASPSVLENDALIDKRSGAQRSDVAAAEPCPVRMPSARETLPHAEERTANDGVLNVVFGEVLSQFGSKQYLHDSTAVRMPLSDETSSVYMPYCDEPATANRKR